jgi:hypothetical protein
VEESQMPVVRFDAQMQVEPMISEKEAAERAEFIQSVKALLIPVSLFLACVIMAAGTFLIYNRESLGWAFVALSSAMIVSAIVALIRFQNTYRARGILKHGTAAEVIDETAAGEGKEEANDVDFTPPQDSTDEATMSSQDQLAEHSSG